MRAKISVVVPIDPRRKTGVVSSIKKQRDPSCIPILEAGPNTSTNRNRGAKKAKTPIIAFANMHTVLADNWSTKVIDFFEKHPEIDIVGGPHLTPKGETRFGKISGYVLGSMFGAAESSARYNVRKEILDADEKYFTAANLACKREVLEKVQFDESLYPGEDPNFIKDAVKAGFKVAYSPELITYQPRRAKLKDFVRQIFFYATARPKKETFKETLAMPSYLVPPLFVIYLAFLPTLFLLNLFFLAPLMLYLILDIWFSIYEGMKNRDLPAIFFLPFLFPIIHITYGLGFIYGFIEHIRKKPHYNPYQ
ncbi:MAG: glycosyltransferase [Nanoarchaeota archaeon]|nr:glycosyltransferase [Nanoarchaeota archaeon]